MTEATSTAPEPRSPGPLWHPLDWLLILAMAVVAAWPLETWISYYLLPCSGDSGRHLLNILNVQTILSGPSMLLDNLGYLAYWPETQGYPPLASYVLGGLGALFGGLEPPDLAALQIVWVYITGCSVYVLSCNVIGDNAGNDPYRGRRVGLLSCGLTFFAPQLVSHVLTFMLDLPCVAMTTLALAAMSCTVKMDRTAPAIIAGVCLALSMLTKWTAIIYTLPALVYLTITTLKRHNLASNCRLIVIVLGLLGAVYAAYTIKAPALEQFGDIRFRSQYPVVAYQMWMGSLVLGITIGLLSRMLPHKLRNLCLMVTFFVLLAAPLYIMSSSALTHRARLHSVEYLHGERHEPPSRNTCVNPNFISYQHPMFSGIIIAGLVWLAFKGRRGSFAMVGMPLVSGTLIIFYCLNLTDTRYLLPGIPLQIVATVGWLQSSKLAHAISLGAIMCFGAWQIANYVSIMPPLEEGHDLKSTMTGTGPASSAYQIDVLFKRLHQAKIATPAAIWIVAQNEEVKLTNFFTAVATTDYLMFPRTVGSDRHNTSNTILTCANLDPIVEQASAPGEGTSDSALVINVALKHPELPIKTIRDFGERQSSELPNSLLVVISDTKCRYSSPAITPCNLRLGRILGAQTQAYKLALTREPVQ